MHPLLRKLFGLNWPLFALMMAMMIFGVYAIYSATWMREHNFWFPQTIWICISLPLFFIVSLCDYRWIRVGVFPAYVISILCLVAVMLFGQRRYGAKSWLDLGPMNFQPSMIAIIAGIFALAVFLQAFRDKPPILRILGCGAIVGAPWIMILVQPDLGACLVWVPVVVGMMFVGGIPKRWLIVLLIVGVTLVPLVVYFGLKPYQYARITTFLNPNADPQGDGWNITQSLIAIGSGGFSGKGFKAPNTQNELGFLPSTIVHNDFIFSVLGEQHGFIGGFSVLLAFALLFVLILHIAMEAGDDLGRLLAIGIAMMLFTHTILNIGMTISVTPITGLPLPLISYGGSFIMSVLISFGVLQSVWIHRRTMR